MLAPRSPRTSRRVSMPRLLAVAAIVVSVGATTGSCDGDDGGTPATNPDGSLDPQGPDSSGTGVGTGSSLPPQQTSAPNPDAGGDGAPTSGSTSP